MDVFPTSEQLFILVGVSPGNNESAGKKKVEEPHTETSKPNPH